MAQPAASIRPYRDSDEKLARFMVAKANMEGLAAANRRAYYHPIVLSVWIGLSCIFIEYMHWWPDHARGMVTYLSPLPAFASVFVPIMFGIDWINRPYFEKLTQDALRAPDMKDIKANYSRSPASGFWILDYGDRFVGLIAIDASVEDTSSNKSRKTTTSQTATIRHFYVQEPYPASGIQHDLLSHAVKHCLNATDIVQQIKALDSPLVPYARKALKDAGFILEKNTERVGVFRWRLGLRALQRDVWEQKRA